MRNKSTVIMLAAIVFIAYLPLRTADFTSFDDPNYVTSNTYIKSGLTINNVMWSFKSTYFSNWHPVTWLSHMADISLYGLRPMGHHLSSVCFHAANSVILYLLLLTMTGKYGQSAAVAALFAVHPFAVESVAWISERKNVLSTFFWLLTLVVYANYVRKPSISKYMAALSIFALSLMSKPMAVTLPLTLLLIDYWPLMRFQTGSRSAVKTIIVEKIPFFVLSFIVGIVTLMVQQKEGAIVPLDAVPMTDRMLNAVLSLWGYLDKTIYPAGYAVFYPHADTFSVAQALLKGLFLLIIGIAAYLWRKRSPYLLTGWLWYLLTLLPVIQVIQVGGAAMADRYAYIPLIGIYIMTCYGAEEIVSERERLRKTTGIAFITVIVALSALTWRQAGIWKDSGTLFKHASRVTDGNYVAYNEYGMSLVKAGRLDDAIAEFSMGLKAAPDNMLLNFNMWEALTALGRDDEAERYFLKALPHGHDFTAEDSLFKSRGIELMRAKNYDKAVRYFLKALMAAPNDAEIYNYLGILMGIQKKYEESLDYLSKGIKAGQTSRVLWELYFHRGLMLKEIGKSADAEESFKESLRLNPNSPILQSMIKRAQHD